MPSQGQQAFSSLWQGEWPERQRKISGGRASAMDQAPQPDLQREWRLPQCAHFSRETAGPKSWLRFALSPLSVGTASDLEEEESLTGGDSVRRGGSGWGGSSAAPLTGLLSPFEIFFPHKRHRKGALFCCFCNVVCFSHLIQEFLQQCNSVLHYLRSGRKQFWIWIV